MNAYNMFTLYVSIGMLAYFMLYQRKYTLFTIDYDITTFTTFTAILTLLAGANFGLFWNIALWSGVSVYVGFVLTRPFDTTGQDENPYIILLEATLVTAAHYILWPYMLWKGGSRSEAARRLFNNEVE